MAHRRARAVGVLWLFVLSLLAAPLGTTSALAQEATEADAPELMPTDTRTAPSIDTALETQLASGPAAAVITTWTRAELSVLARVGIAGAQQLRYLPMAFATITRAQLDQLRTASEVRSVWSNEAFPVAQSESTYVVQAREAWKSFGATGVGVELAVIDTGIDGMHADHDNLVEFCESQQSATSARVTVFCSPFNAAAGNAGPAGATNEARTDSTDDDGHGSHVSGTMAGSGDASGGRTSPSSVIGIAPDAKLRVYSSNVGIALLGFQILSSYDDLTYKKANGFNNVVAVNNSWGGGTGLTYDPNDPFNVAANEAYKVGILSVFSAGNSGPEHNTLGRNCINPFVVCVAASSKNDQITMFSSRGRPSEPSDTNRDGKIDTSDVAPDNHDRQLGQALNLGLYRPTLTAPGLAIFSVSANEAGCREGVGTNQDCYVALNGTSMSAPHVTGAAGVIAQAFRDARGRLPTPSELTRLLEHSANLNKLPGWEAEEQGAGRLNVLEAVRMATGKSSKDRTKLVLGYPNPATTRTAGTATGCTTALSWSTGVGFGEHKFTIPENAERFRLRLTWNVTGDNLYTQMWRPGVDPDATTRGEGRVFPDQEHANLLHMSNVTQGVGIPHRFRLMDVRAPEAGEWTLRVYSRIDDSPEPPCGGTPYSIATELFTVASQPTVAITSPADGTTVTGATTISGSATYPAMGNGVTNRAVPGSGVPTALAGTRFYMHGNTHDAGYTGDGKTDYAAGNKPFLSTDPVDTGTRATWKASPWLTLFDELSPDLPSWRLALTQPSVLEGPTRFSFWGSCDTCTGGGDWIITVWADGTRSFTVRRTADIPLITPARFTIDVELPRIKATNEIVVSIDPVFLVDQASSTLYYDSAEQCEANVVAPHPDAAEQSLACDSYALLPIRADTGVFPPDAPANVGVTERNGSVRVSWAAVSGATSYEVHRSTDPKFIPGRKTLLATTTATSIDDAGKPNVTQYYRVIAFSGTAQSKPSLLAYGASRKAEEPERLVLVRTDRVFGPRYWHFAQIPVNGTTWTTSWDAGQVSAGQHTVGARSVAQGVASPGVTITLTR